MTPAEKALKLTNEMYKLQVFGGWSEAKQCSIVSVDVVINSLKSIKHPTNVRRTNRRIDRIIKEWNEVKQEIEKL